MILEKPERPKEIDPRLRRDLLDLFTLEYKKRLNVLDSLQHDAQTTTTGKVELNGQYFILQTELGDAIDCLENNLTHCYPKIYSSLERMLQLRKEAERDFTRLASSEKIPGLSEEIDKIQALKDQLERFL